MLVPDKIDEESAGGGLRLGVSGHHSRGLLPAEMGNKIQIVTVALAARYTDIVGVVAGRYLGDDAGEARWRGSAPGHTIANRRSLLAYSPTRLPVAVPSPRVADGESHRAPLL